MQARGLAAVIPANLAEGDTNRWRGSSTFIDPAWGRVEGIAEIQKFLADSMAGLEGWSFPREWTAVEGNLLVTGWQRAS